MLKIKNKKLVWTLAIGILLRILLASFLYHTDTKAIYRDARLTRDNLIAGYENAAANDSPLFYPPIVYMFLNAHQKTFSFLFSNYFDTFMNDWSYKHTANNPHIFRDLLAMKLPFLIADFLIGIVIYRTLKGRKKYRGLFLWLFNPVSLYVIYATGQYDVIVSLLLVLSWSNWHKKHYNISYLLIGAAAAGKQFALLFLPFLWLIDQRKPAQKSLSFISALIVYVASFLPIITSRVALQGLFLNNPGRAIFDTGIPIGTNGETISLFFLLYAFFFLSILLGFLKKISFSGVITILLGFLFALSHFHPQWIIWMLPFLTILIVEGKIGIKEVIAWMLSLFIVIGFIDDKFVSFGLLKAINNAFDSLPSLYAFTQKVFIEDKVVNLGRALFLASTTLIVLEVVGKLKPKAVLQKVPALAKTTILCIGTLIVIFLTAHIPLTFFGYYTDTSHMEQQKNVTLLENAVIDQKVHVNNDNFVGIQLRVKNTFKNTDDLVVEILDDAGNLLRQNSINGKQVGDNYDLRVLFTPIPDSADNVYIIRIYSPKPTRDKEYLVAYNEDSDESFNMVGSNKKGQIAYSTYFRPQWYKQNLVFSLKNIVDKL